ncbi:hypothetical protein PENSPDRAFT_219263 [Peniophora sp. CONT]|nr:hypothetical protein PENSPDRAFT_219263 [Peniophora sp. CONT]
MWHRDWDCLETVPKRSKLDTGPVSPLARSIVELKNRCGESSRSHAVWKMLHDYVHRWCARRSMPGGKCGMPLWTGVRLRRSPCGSGMEEVTIPHALGSGSLICHVVKTKRPCIT